MKGRLPLLAMVTAAATLLGAPAWQGLVSYSKPDRVQEREVRELLRELERDLQRNWRFEFIGHVAHTEGAGLDEAAHAVTDRLSELTALKRLRFVDVEIAVDGTNALAQPVVEGDAPDSAGHLSLASEAVLLRLERQQGDWKIKDIFTQTRNPPACLR